jgi:hypothetical protein
MLRCAAKLSILCLSQRKVVVLQDDKIDPAISP